MADEPVAAPAKGRKLKIKVFVGNFDGRRSGLVRATSAQKAAAVAGCSLHAFNQFWASREDSTPEIDGLDVDTLYTRKIGHRYGDKDLPWIKGRCPL